VHRNQRYYDAAVRAWAFVAAMLLFAGCSSDRPAKTTVVTFAQGSAKLTIRAEIASTPDARQRGLMGRRSLDADAGMLFVFPTPVLAAFYMKDTLIPLDIAFISQGRVIEIRTMQPCRATPCPRTFPASMYEWALEVNAGTFARAGITSGAVADTSPRLAPAD
jgi:hypothetical protein